MATAQFTLTAAAQRVLDAASRLFYQRGINTVGVDLVAAEAGVTKKTIYDRFGSKDALIAAYLQQRDQRWRGWLQERLDVHTDARDQILATFDALEEWSRQHTRGCAMLNAHSELADPAHPGRAVVADQKRWLHGLYAGLLDRAGLDDDLAVALLVLHEGAVSVYHAGARPEAIMQARRAAAALLASGPHPVGE